jgi:thiamine biosynthesis lipoprotein
MSGATTAAAVRSDRFAALGTTALVAVAADDGSALAIARDLLHDQLDEIDRACSRFRPDSELNAVNAAAGAAVGVSTTLLEAVRAALHAAGATGGAVDPTVGRSVRELGYDCDFALIAPEGRHRATVRLRRAGGWRSVTLDPSGRTIRIPAGVELDLGSTGKAWAADRAAGLIARETGLGVLVGLGGDIAIAGEAPPGGWPVRVTDDHRRLDGDGPTIALGGGGLATSSTTVRRWSRGGVERHHIVDPRTGASATEVWRTASAVAASCVDANAASTAAIVLGEAASGWLAERGIAARLVRPDGAVVVVAGWPEDEEGSR